MHILDQKRAITPLIAHAIAAAFVLLGSTGLVSISFAQTTIVQSGTTTFTSVSKDISIASVDLTKSFLVFSYTVDNAGPSQFLVRGDLTSPTNIHFERVGSSGSPTVTLAWYVAEFSSGVTVQRGNDPHNSATVNIPISAVVLSKSFPLVSWQNTGSIWGTDDGLRARLTSATNLELDAVSRISGNVNWQVVEFDGTLVQRGQHTLGTGDVSATVAITAVDLTKAFVIVTNTNGGNGFPDDLGIQAEFSAANALTFTRGSTGPAVEINWVVVEFTSDELVQSGSTIFAPGETVRNIPISSIDLTKSVAFLSQYQRGGQGTVSSPDNPGHVWFAADLTSNTNLQLTRALGSGGSSAEVEWFIVEFSGLSDITAPFAPAIIQPTSPTGDSTPLITGTASEDGGTITLTSDIDGVLAPTASVTGGSWSIQLTSALSKTTHFLTATHTDASGNVSPVSGSVTIVVIDPPPAVASDFQRGTTTFTSTSTDVSIASVDLTKSFLVFSYTVDNEGPSQFLVRGDLTSPTNIHFERVGSSGSPTVTLAWYVAEFSSGVTVQRGNNPHNSATVNIPISPVDLSESFPLVSWQNTGSIWGTDDGLRARLTSAANLELDAVSRISGNVNWQVVEFDGASVQRGQHTLGTGDVSATVGITAVDLTKAFVIVTNTNGGNGFPDDLGIQAEFSAANALTFTRGSTGPAIEMNWVVVEFTNDESVQSGSTTFAPGETVSDVSISSIDLTKSVAFLSQYQRGGQGTVSSPDNPGHVWFAADLTSSTNLQLTRALGSGGSSAEVEWFVVEFSGLSDITAPFAPAIIQPTSPTGDSTPLITGTASEDGGTITLTSDVDGLLAPTATVSGGTWSIQLTSTLSEATHSITATHTDASGNTSFASSASTLVIDLTPPTPVLASLESSPTNAEPVPFSIDFGETIDNATFDLSDVTVSSGSAQNLVNTGDDQNFTFEVASPNDGEALAVSIAANVLTDAGGTNNLVSNTVNLAVDKTPPAAPVITQPASPTNNTTPLISGTASEDGGTITLSSDIDGVLAPTTTVTGGAWSLQLTSALSEAIHSITAIHTDAAGNTSIASGATPLVIDTTPPTPVLASSESSPTNSALIPIAIDFGESIDVATFDLSDIGVTSGAAQNLVNSGDDQTFTFEIVSPNEGETLGVSIAADVFTDAGGTNNLVSNTLSLIIDRTPPTAPVITQPSSPTNDTTPVILGTTSEDDGTITITLSSNSGLVRAVTAVVAGGTWSIQLTSPLKETTYTITATHTDVAGNVSPVSVARTLIIDRTPSAPILASSESGPTNADIVSFTVDFVEIIDVATFDLSDVTVSSGAAQTLLNSGDDQNFTFEVASATDGESLTVSIATDALTDVGGTNNLASNTVSLAIDRTPPEAPVITLPASPTNDTTPMISGTASEDGGTITLISDIDGVLIPAATVTGGTWSILLTNSLNEATYSITAIHTDTAGNTSAISSVLLLVVDRTPPTPTIASSTSGLTNADPVPFTIDFGEPIDIATFDLNDVTVSSGSPRTLVNSGDNQFFTFEVASPTDGDELTVSIDAGVLTDAAGNPSFGSDAVSLLVDTTLPTPTIASLTSGLTNADPVPFTIDFGEAIDAATFDLNDITVSSGSVQNLVNSGDDQYFTFEVASPTDGDELTVSIDAGVLTDAAGNPSFGSNAVSLLVDTTPPTPTIASSTSGVTNADPVPFTIDFGEAIDAATFDFSDITVSSGAVQNLVNSGDDQRYALEVASSADGELLAVRIAADALTDVGGTMNLESNTVSLAIDRSPPTAPVIMLPASPTNDTTPMISGTASEEGGTITLRITLRITLDIGGVVATTTTVTGGAWSIQLMSELDEAIYSITAIHADAVGNTSLASEAMVLVVDTTPPTPTIASPITGPTNANQAPFSVAFSEPIDTATFDVGDISISSGAVQNLVNSGDDQHFTFEVASPTDGELLEVSIAADALSDAAGTNNLESNTVNLAIDGTPPAAPVITQPPSPTNDSTPMISGTASEEGGTITLTSDIDGVLVTTATVTSGTWSIQLTSVLTEATHFITAIHTDAAGNLSPSSAARSLTIDRTPPTPTIASSVSDVPNTGPVTFTIDFGEAIDAATFDATDVTVSSGYVQNLVNSGDNQHFTFDVAAPNDGETLTVSIAADALSDVGGTNNRPSNTVSLTIDRTPPEAPVITELTSPINVTTPVIMGSASEDGGTITLTSSVDGILTPSVTVTGGVWSIQLMSPLSEATHIITAIHTDASGNVSPSSNQKSFVIDGTPYLNTNYPNPFRGQTTFTYGISREGHVSLVVYDLMGRKVRVLIDDEKPAGHYRTRLNLSELSSGVYVYRLVTPSGAFARLMHVVD